MPNFGSFENLHWAILNFFSEQVRKEFAINHGYDLDGTPMSVTDVQSPMSVDRSMAETSILSAELTDNSQAEGMADLKTDADLSLLETPVLPRNDRQRFYEVVQYQHDILQNFRESEVSTKL